MMPDREKVINGLRICFMQKDCDGCPYQKELKAILDKPHNDDWHCPILDDALELLKEQDAEVEPKRMYHAERASFDNYLCECKSELYYTQRYCDVCGRSVKWE